MNPPELTEPASARGSARTSLCELPLRSQRVGGFGLHELTVTAAQVKALLCGICKLVVREAMHMDTAANLVPSCEHVFCASCLEGRLELFRTGEALQCPVCGRFVGAVHADPFLDSVVLTLLAQSTRPQPRGHAHYSLQFKAEAVQVWDSAGWSVLHNLHPHLPWSTADYWRRNPAVLASDGDQQRSGRQPTFTVEEDEFIRKQTLAIPGAGVDDITPIALRLAQQRGQDPSVAPEAKARYENFKGSPHWLADYLTKMQLSEHIPHPVSMSYAGSSGQGQGITSGTRVLFVRV